MCHPSRVEKAFLANGARYACFVGRRNIGEGDVQDAVGNDDIRIAPIVQGNLSTYVAEVPTNVGNPDFMSIFQAVMARQSGSTLSLASCGLGVGPYQTPANTPTVSRPNWSYTIIDVSGL